jgi:hypothetical protein
MKNTTISLILVAALSGCAGTQSHMRILEQSNAISVAPSSAPGYEYAVSVRNVKDIGYNPNNKADRDSVALRYMASQCPKGRIVGETPLNTGTYLLGDPAITYIMHVKC